MKPQNCLTVACSIGIVALATVPLMAQGSAATPQTPPRRPSSFNTGLRRPPGDPAVVAHGKALYGVSCQGCHGADLRGGDLGGPNLLRSQVALSDQHGELIVPIVQGSRQDAGMPAIPISQEDAAAVAAYVRSVVDMIGSQGRPPSVGKAAPSILVGDAKAGQVYFAAKCSSCHSGGDMRTFVSNHSDPKSLQTAWVSGGRRRRVQGPGAPTVTITQLSGETIEGRLVRIDDFLVTVGLADGTTRTFSRDGDVPKVEVHDPMKAHRDLMAVYTDKDIHDVTAYLVTLK